VPHSNYLPSRMETAEISARGRFETGSFQSFTLVYTAGYFGIDETGSIKMRIASPATWGGRTSPAVRYWIWPRQRYYRS
jgi:hypothetical protein